MRDLVYPTVYFDVYDNPLGGINISVPLSDDYNWQLTISDAGDKAFGSSNWAKAHAQGLDLIVENGEAIEARKAQKAQSQVVQMLAKIEAAKED